MDVVEARTTVAATPIVPLMTMFQAAHSPASDRLNHSTSTRGSRPRIGNRTANSRNGTSMTSRLATDSSGTPPMSAASTTSDASTPNAQN